MSQKPTVSPNREKNGYVIAFSVIGIILGAGLGYFASAGFVGLFLVVLCTLGGAVLGGAVGNFIGERLKEHSASNHDRRKDDESK
jgi:outer membrane lipoprotein SlyB